MNKLITDQSIFVLDRAFNFFFPDSLLYSLDKSSFCIPFDLISPCPFIDSLVSDIESLWLDSLFSDLENLHLPICTPVYRWEDDKE